MKILIGDNIRRLRRQGSTTQEQLAEMLGVTCAAVSKWERGETYPDITLLFPLAHFFQVTVDELMGFDEDLLEREIDAVLQKYGVLCQDNASKARAFITQAYGQYPNDDRIMHRYMWDIAGGLADNQPEDLLAHKEEFLSICDKILKNSEREELRLDAWNMKAKILHAEGRTEEALAVYREKFVSWFQTSGQKTEQLFGKDTPEFLYWVKRNLYELANFAADKLVKSIFFDQKIKEQERIGMIERCGDLLKQAALETGSAFFIVMESSLWGRLYNDMKYRGADKAEAVARILNKKEEARKALVACAQNEPLLAETVL